MEKRQDAQDTITVRNSKNLAHAFEIRIDIVVRKHNPLRVASAAAGKNDRGQIVNAPIAAAPEHRLQEVGRQEQGQQQRHHHAIERLEL